MKGILIGLQIIVLNMACFCQSIDQQLIGSIGHYSDENCKTSLIYSVGEVMVDYYKCYFNLRVGFIQAVESPLPDNALSRATNTFSSNVLKSNSLKRIESDIANLEMLIYDSSGRIIYSGISRDDKQAYLQNLSSGIYFIQTRKGASYIGTEKIVISR